MLSKNVPFGSNILTEYCVESSNVRRCHLTLPNVNVERQLLRSASMAFAIMDFRSKNNGNHLLLTRPFYKLVKQFFGQSYYPLPCTIAACHLSIAALTHHTHIYQTVSSIIILNYL